MRGIFCLFGVLALLVVAAVQDEVRPREQGSPPRSVEAANAADVRSNGEVGDGGADDTDALQAAVDAGVGCIRLPKGVYRITQPIVVDLEKSGYTSFAGDGVATIVMAGPGPAKKPGIRRPRVPREIAHFWPEKAPATDPPRMCKRCQARRERPARAKKPGENRSKPQNQAPSIAAAADKPDSMTAGAAAWPVNQPQRADIPS